MYHRKYRQLWGDCKADAVAEVAGRAVRHFSWLSLARHPPLRCCTVTAPTPRAQLLPPPPAGSRTTYAQRARLQIFAVASVAAAAKRTFIFSLLFIGVRVCVCVCVSAT